MDQRNQAFGEAARAVRHAQGLSQEEVSLALEAVDGSDQAPHRVTVGKIERGIADTTLDTVCRLAAALDVDPIELFQRFDASQQEG